MDWKAVLVVLSCLVACLAFPVPPKFNYNRRTTFSKPGKRVEVADIDTSSEDKDDNQQLSVDDCTQFCSYTYPQHTYSVSAHFKACTSGCRTAQVNALIAWPLKPTDSCVPACHEAYPSDSDAQYACTVGCHASTIDSIFPERDLVYNTLNDTVSSLAFFQQVTILLSSITDSFFFSGPSIDDLVEHAHKMSEMVSHKTGQVQSSIVTYYIMDNGEVVEVDVIAGSRDENDNKVDDFPFDIEEEADINSLSNSDSMSNPSVDSNSMYVYYKPATNERCKWITRRMLAGRLLLGLSLLLILLSLLACFLSVFKRNKKGGDKFKPTFVTSHSPYTTKVPLTKSSEYNSHMMLPVHIKVGGEKTVEGLLTVVA